MSRLGASPPPMCTCGHGFHRGACQEQTAAYLDDARSIYCHCPDGELDGDR